MQTIHSRTYTNVALTALILLLLVLVVRPYVGLPTASARASNMEIPPPTDTKGAQLQDPYTNVVQALHEIALSNREVASAIRETALSQTTVARAIQSLTAGAAPQARP